MAQIICPVCGKENVVGNHFCKSCGAKLDIAALAKSNSSVDQQIALDLTDVEFLPYLPEEHLKDATYQKYPLSNLTALGVSVQPLTVAIQNIVGGGAGKSGIYYVKTYGKTMFEANDGSGRIGSLKSASGAVGGGQAKMTQIPLDPTMIFMSAALMNIEMQLANIQEMQQEMMDFLKAQEKAKLRGDINTLIDVLNNYKFNWENETYKTNKHILVQDIRRDAEQSIQLSQDRLQSALSKRDLIANNQKVKAKVDKTEEALKDYQMALYQYSFASFLEIMLLSNFEENYLNSVVSRIEELSAQYREYYNTCYEQLETMSKGTVESFLATGIAGVTKGAGKAIEKVPVLNKGPVDEALIAASGKINEMKGNKTSKEMNRLVELAENGTNIFVERISEVNQLYNVPKEIYFDQENLYLVNAG